jgi:hypothetical protein
MASSKRRTKMKIQAMTLVALFLAGPVTVHAQSSIRAEGSASASVGGRGSQGDHGSAAGSAALEATAAAGLPEAHVRRAIREGEAKGASRARIDRAAMEAHGRVRGAAELFAERGNGGRAASEAEITAAAEAMASGASRADISRLRNAAPADRSLVVSLEALAQLSASGMGARDASGHIASRLRSGASDAEITGLASGAGSLVGSRSGSAGGALDASSRIGAGASGLGAAVNGAARVTGSLGGGIF